MATPIGNLDDLSPRARRVLAEVDVIAAEDTRVTARLLDHYGIRTRTLSVHDHNERQRTPGLVDRLTRGESIALVSDAGTPLVSDPGHVLVRAAIDAGIRVIPVAGPSAVLTALSASGLPVNRFAFDGFLPAKPAARVRYLESIRSETRTIAVFESPRRILASLGDMRDVLGGARRIVIARELTKRYERFYRGTLDELVEADALPEGERRGELVIVIHPGDESSGVQIDDATLLELATALPVKQAADIVSRISGERRNQVYERALRLRSDGLSN